MDILYDKVRSRQLKPPYLPLKPFSTLRRFFCIFGGNGRCYLLIVTSTKAGHQLCKILIVNRLTEDSNIIEMALISKHTICCLPPWQRLAASIFGLQKEIPCIRLRYSASPTLHCRHFSICLSFLSFKDLFRKKNDSCDDIKSVLQ